MAFIETLQEFNQFITEHSGVTTKVIHNILCEDKPKPIQSFFFKPYGSVSDPLNRVTSLITDPVILSIFAIENALGSVFFAGKGLVNLAMWDLEDAKESFGISASGVLLMLANIFAATLSALINAIDLVGGGITSLLEDTSEEGNSPSC